jgi:hypothetical protein
MERRTNCDNCGAVLVKGKCQHCGSVWFKEGFTIGEHGYISQATFETLNSYGDSYRDLTGMLRMVARPQEYRVSLDIIGLSSQEVHDLYESIKSGFPQMNFRKDG